MAEPSALRSHKSKADLPSEAWERLELLLERFEDAWRRGERPAIEDHLREASPQEQRCLLVELVHAEFDYRLRAGETARVEGYLSRYPQLREDSAVAIELILAELALRRGRGENPAVTDYLSRFPQHADALRQRLSELLAPPLPSALEMEAAPNRTASPSMAAAVPETLRTQNDAEGQSVDGAVPIALPGYEILGKLGEGGMGVVYKARQTVLGRTVALKMILHTDHAGADARARFKAEAKAVASLQHPNIVQIHEVGEHKGLPYFSLEFCPGGSLDKKLSGTPLLPSEAAALVQTLAVAMQAAHDKDILHRDLKPANVLLAEDGTPKITDFGLAKKLGEPGQTRTGDIMGTPSYMAPEQAGGKNKEVGPATDTYALGAILYECLTGRPPFKAATAFETMLQVVNDEPVSVRQLQPKLPRDIETICQKCLQKEPRKRYASALVLAEDLRRFQAGEPVQARPVGWPERFARWSQRRPATAVLLATVFLIALAVPLALLGHTMRLQDALNAVEEERDHARRAEYAARLHEAEVRVSNYASDLHLAHNLFKVGDVFQLPGLLDPHRRDDGSVDDLRDFSWGYLQRHSQAARPLLEAHDGPVRLLRYSPDGESLITSGGGPNKQVINVWDRMSRRLRYCRPLLSNDFSAIVSFESYAPAGNLLAGITEPTIVTLWDASSGKQRLRLPQVEHAYHIALSPDGSRLAVTAGRVTSVWNCSTGKKEFTRPVLGESSHLAFAPDGKTLAVEVQSPSFVGIQWWDPISGRTKGEMKTPDRVTSLDYSPRGTFLLICYGGSGAIWHATHHIPLHWSDTIGPCSSLASSPDERTLAISGPDGQILLRDIATGRLRGRYRWQPNPVVQVVFSPDNRTLAAATVEGQILEMDATVDHFPDCLQTFAVKGPLCWSPDGETLAVAAIGGTVRLLNRRTGKQSLVLRCPAGEVRCLAFSPDGHTLATSCHGEKIVRLWNSTNGRLRTVTTSEHTEAAAIAFSPDGRSLVAAIGERVRFSDPATGSIQATLEVGHPIQDLVFTPDGRSLLTAGQTIEVWDLGGRDYLPRKSAGFGQVGTTVHRLAIASDGRRVATAEVDGTNRVWRLSADKKLTPDGPELPWHTRKEPLESLGFAPDNRTLIVFSLGVGRLCDLSTRGSHQDFFTGSLSQAALSPNGQTIAIMLRGVSVQFWDLSSWRVLQPCGQVLIGVNSLLFSADGRNVVTAGPLGQVRVRNWKLIRTETAPLRSTSESLRFWDVGTGQEEPSAVSTRETMSLPYIAARSPDGRLLAAGSEDGSITIWDWSKGNLLTRVFVNEKVRVYAEICELARGVVTNSSPDYKSKGEAILGLTFSEDGSSFVAAGDRGSIRVWETACWKERGSWRINPGGSPWIAFNPNGDSVVGSSGGQVRVWESRTGEVQARFGKETDSPILCGAFAPGKDLLAVGAKDGTIRLWDLGDGGGKRLPGGHQDRVTSLAFAPDGKTLASCSWDRTVRLWNMAACREVAALEGHKRRVNAVSFSPNGILLASGGDGEVLFWRQ